MLLEVLVLSVVLVAALKIYFVVNTRMCRSQNRLDGKTVILTGGSAGIGKETALDLAGRGARVILACRNVPKANVIKDFIIKESNNENVLVKELDLASFDSVRRFAADIIQNESQIHVLINNAGVSSLFKKELTKDGIELQMQSNHFGHFLLTNLLLGVILKTDDSRIINVSSSNHSQCQHLDLVNITFAKEGTGEKLLEIYNASKLCNVLFTRYLAQLIEGQGSKVTVNALHPGLVRTEIFDHMGLLVRFGYFLSSFVIKTAKEGAQTSIYLAVSEEVSQVSGQYFVESQMAKMSELSKNRELAEKLWQVSERIVGLTVEEKFL